MSWRDGAACSGMTEVFWPVGGMDPVGVERARDVCAGCPVRSECLDYALSLDDDPVGVWGGVSENQRRKIRRARRAVCRSCGVEVGRNPNGRARAKWCEPCMKERRAVQQQRSARERAPDLTDSPGTCVVCRVSDTAAGRSTCQSWACQRVHRRRAVDSELVA